jgi:hypothetical protein
MLSPDIWTDEGFLSLTLPARLLFIGLISHADDEGRGCGDWRTIKAKVFPSDDFTTGIVGDLCDEVAKHVKVVFYEVEGTRFYQLARWQNHQSIKDKRTSTIPPLPGTLPEPPRNTPDTPPLRKEGRKEYKEKKEYAPGVSLTLKEHEDLTEKHGGSLLSEAIEYLSAYKETHAKHYASDAGALRQFGIKAALERRDKARKGGMPPRPGVVEFKGRQCAKCGKVQTTSAGMCLDCGEELPRGRA